MVVVLDALEALRHLHAAKAAGGVLRPANSQHQFGPGGRTSVQPMADRPDAWRWCWMVLRAPDGCSRALESGRRPRAVLAAVALCAVLMLWCALFIHVLTEFPRTQWDFGSFYFGAKSYSLGLDPYEKGNLSAVAGERQPFPYTQTLACAYLLYPFTWVDFHSAWCAWYVVKAILLVALARLWWRLIGSGLSPPLYYTVLLLGFNAAIGWDLVAGNKSIIEQLLLWWGIGHYLRGRWSRFAALTSAAGVFNIMPAALLGLVLGAPTS